MVCAKAALSSHIVALSGVIMCLIGDDKVTGKYRTFKQQIFVYCVC